MNSDVLRRFETFLATPELPSIGPNARATRNPLSEVNSKLDEAIRETQIDSGEQALIRSLVLLWHDHLDASHSLSQEIHNADGSVLHGIMHRREPDYWNAKYWFNRVGDHSAFPLIAARASEFLKAKGENALANELVRSGKWQAGAFVDACERAAKSETSLVETLQQLQEIEFRALLEHFCRGAQ